MSNRRQALWNAGLDASCRGAKASRPLPLTITGQAARLPDFTDFEKMAGEYRVLGIYPGGHLMQFVRPGLDQRVLPTTAIEHQEDGNGSMGVRLAGGSAASPGPAQHRLRDHRGRGGRYSTDCLAAGLRAVQASNWAARLSWPGATVSHRDGAATVIVSDVHAIDPRVAMPEGHDWH